MTKITEKTIKITLRQSKEVLTEIEVALPYYSKIIGPFKNSFYKVVSENDCWEIAEYDNILGLYNFGFKEAFSDSAQLSSEQEFNEMRDKAFYFQAEKLGVSITIHDQVEGAHVVVHDQIKTT